jgi:BTB/POZ domain
MFSDLTLTSFSGLGVEFVDIYVGKNQKHFRVHKKILCEKIKYFDDMFNKGFEEAQTSVAQLPEDDETSFDVLLGWLYTGSLRRLENKGTGGPKKWNWAPSSMFILVDKLCLAILMNEVMDQWMLDFATRGILPLTSSISQIYQTTRKGSGARKFAINTVFYILHEERAKQSFTIWKTEEILKLMQDNEELGLDVLELMRAHSPGTHVLDPRRLPPCEYHLHEGNAPCPGSSLKSNR